MARIPKSAIDAALNTVKSAAKAADEVIENAGKGTSRAHIIKNAVNTVQSNMSGAQARNLANAGEAATNAVRREGIEAATQQIKARTTQKAMNQATSRTGSAVQKSREIIEQKKVNQVITGHNARSRQTAMDTIVNNVKDQNINRAPNGHETARNAVNQASENVRKARQQKVDWLNNNDNQLPIVNRTAYDTNPKASPIIQNGPDKPKPTVFNQERPKQNFKEVPRPETPPEARPNPFDNKGPEPQIDVDANDINRPGEDIGFDYKNFGNKTLNFFTGGITDTYQNVRNGQGIFEAIGNAHMKDGKVDLAKAAGTFMTVSAAGRIASGGGLYKDRYGNPNLIGVPFI